MQQDNYTYRLLYKGDEEHFFQLVDSNKDRLENFFAGTLGKNKSLEETILFVKEVTQKAADKLYYPFLIIDPATQKMIGYIDIKNIDWKIPKGELGYFIDRNYEGKGIITAALKMIIRYCFEDMGFNKLLVRTHHDNISSKKAVEKNGFIIEGRIRKDHRIANGELVDLLYYGLVK